MRNGPPPDGGAALKTISCKQNLKPEMRTWTNEEEMQPEASARYNTSVAAPASLPGALKGRKGGPGATDSLERHPEQASPNDARAKRRRGSGALAQQEARQAPSRGHQPRRRHPQRRPTAAGGQPRRTVTAGCSRGSGTRRDWRRHRRRGRRRVRSASPQRRAAERRPCSRRRRRWSRCRRCATGCKRTAGRRLPQNPRAAPGRRGQPCRT